MNRLPIVFLRFEGLAVFIAMLYLYANCGLSWWLFVAVVLVPDVFMVGYFKNTKLGAVLYNIGHWYVVPLGLAGISVWQNYTLGMVLAIIWTAHIAMDRMLGFGLKYPDSFKHTHLGDL